MFQREACVVKWLQPGTERKISSHRGQTCASRVNSQNFVFLRAMKTFLKCVMIFNQKMTCHVLTQRC